MLPLLVLLGTIAGAWYLLIVRPQKEQQTRHGRLVERLQVGDHVLTVGGIYGRVVALDGSGVVLELAPGLTSRIAVDGIARIVQGAEASLPVAAEPAPPPEPAPPAPAPAPQPQQHQNQHPHQATEHAMHQQHNPHPNQPQPQAQGPDWTIAPQPMPQPAAAAPMPMPAPGMTLRAQVVSAPVPVVPAPASAAPAPVQLPTFNPRPWGDVAPVAAPAQPQAYAPAQPQPAQPQSQPQPQRTLPTFAPIASILPPPPQLLGAAQPQPQAAPPAPHAAPQQPYASQPYAPAPSAHASTHPAMAPVAPFAAPQPAAPPAQPYAVAPSAHPQHPAPAAAYALQPAPAPVPAPAAAYAPAVDTTPAAAHPHVQPPEQPERQRRHSRAPQGMGSTLRLDDPSLRDTIARARGERADLAEEYRRYTASLVDTSTAEPQQQHAVDPTGAAAPQFVGYDAGGTPLFAAPGSAHVQPIEQYPAAAHVPSHPAAMPRPVVTPPPGAPDPALSSRAFQHRTPYAPQQAAPAAADPHGQPQAALA